jgi:4-methylaminobutanoate oxidase (formaldehyde-forming)
MTETLPAHAQTVIIGGGIIGASTAYHLAKDHKAEVLLLERARLTSGSTWHAAGLVGQLRSSASITQLLRYSVDLYRRLAAETGLDTGWRMTGCLRLAMSEERVLEYKRLATTARSFGLEMHLLSPAEVKRMWPLMATSDLVGASFLPSDGQANPSDITQSLAKGARSCGAALREGVAVTGFEIAGGRVTAVRTSHGRIACEKVVLTAGQWSRQIAAKAGVSVPLQPIRHQYVITEKIAGVTAGLPTVRDPDRRTYFKEEVGGLVFGGYEPDPVVWTTGEVPEDFEFRLFDDDWDHFEQHMRSALARVPALERIGIRQMINGPESFTPDGNFILGAAPELQNFFVGAGFNAFGIASAGGAGWALAQWVATGEAPMDLWVVDIRRFAALHRDREWVASRTLEAYGKHYSIAYPYEEYESARRSIVSPLYRRLERHGAVFGSKLGWERPNWFAPPGIEARDRYSMNRQNWFDHVGREHRAVRETAGLFDQSSFAKYELAGKDAGTALSWLCANHVTKPAGRVTYTQMLNSRGGIECDLTVSRLRENLFYVVTGTGFRTHDHAWIRDHIRPGADVCLRDVTEELGTLSLMGPNARRILSSAANEDVSNAAFPFGHVRLLTLAGHPVRALRLTYVGELGWELHIPVAGLGDVFDLLMERGAPHRLALAGYRALESLRLEKGYRAWGADITPNDNPFEAGLSWALKLKSDLPFLGREAMERQSNSVPKKKLACFVCEDSDVVLLGRETILRNGEPAGYLTSGGYGYTLGKPIGYGYVRDSDGVTDDYLAQASYELIVATEPKRCRVVMGAPFDPEGVRMRA